MYMIHLFIANFAYYTTARNIYTLTLDIENRCISISSPYKLKVLYLDLIIQHIILS